MAVFRLPLPLYRRGWGWLLGDTFLLLVHAGRKTVVAGFQRRHPYWSRLLASVLGWEISAPMLPRDFVSTRPFVCMWPLDSARQNAGGEGHD